MVGQARIEAIEARLNLRLAVDTARIAGASWREIGEVFGTSRQAANQRWGSPGNSQRDERLGGLNDAGST